MAFFTTAITTLKTLVCAIGADVYKRQIPRTEALAETASEGVSIFSYDAKGKGAYSYQALRCV